MFGNGSFLTTNTVTGVRGLAQNMFAVYRENNPSLVIHKGTSYTLDWSANITSVIGLSSTRKINYMISGGTRLFIIMTDTASPYNVYCVKVLINPTDGDVDVTIQNTGITGASSNASVYNSYQVYI